MSIDAATLDRLRAIVGPSGYLDRPTDVLLGRLVRVGAQFRF